MKDRGGRAFKRLCAAAALALLLFPILPFSEAQSVNDPWFGSVDRTKPTQGFAVRVPVVVQNRFDHAMSEPYVAAEIDFKALLVEAGWTNQTVGADARLRGFTLDLDSIRVVEYSRGFVTGPLAGSDTRPIPHVFYPALLESGRFSPFDPAFNPAGTVLFQVPGVMQPEERRYFYVFAHPQEYADTLPYKYDLMEKSPLDAFLWGTHGTVTYGYEPNQDSQNHFLQIIATTTRGPTSVTVSTFEFGRFTPIASTSTTPNPFTLQPGASRPVFVPAGRAFKIESSQPVMVGGHGAGVQNAGREVAGYIPGLSGSFADDTFNVFGYRGETTNFGGLTGAVRLIKASPGTVVVTDESTGRTSTLTNAQPIGDMQVRTGAWSRLSGTGKFLVSMGKPPPPGSFQPDVFAPHPVPSLSGGPAGVSFYTHLQNPSGYLALCPEANSTVRIVDLSQGGSIQISPEGTVPNVPPKFLVDRDTCEEVEVPSTAPASSIWEIYATKEDRDPVPNAPVPFRVFVGTRDRSAVPENNDTRPYLGHFGGVAGTDYHAHGSIAIFGHYNGTRVTIFEERIRNGETYVTNVTTGIDRDTFTPVLAQSDSLKRYHIVSTKPIGVVSTESATYFETDPNARPPAPVSRNIPYARHVPGRPEMPAVTIGKAEFKGPLVDIRGVERPEHRQIDLSTGPNTPVSAVLDVWNLGRWANGADLPDTVTIACSVPVGWTIEGCNRDINLASASSDRLVVTATPPPEDVNQTRKILVEAKSKLGGPVARMNITVKVRIEYGVGMWFDEVDGAKKIDPPIGLDPGGVHTFNIVVKNLGSTQDTFRFRVDDPVEGWSQELLANGEPAKTVSLGGNETTILNFRVRAPNTETARVNLPSITAESLASAGASAVVYPASRIRPKVDLEMILATQTKIAPPNETVVFNISTRNKGNDIFNVLFDIDSILPRGWTARLSIDEITLVPNKANDPSANYVLQLFVTPPLDARAGDLASVKIAAEVDTGGAGGRVPGDEVSAIVVVQRVYALTTPPVLDAEARPGESLQFVLPVTNAGNGQVVLEQLPGAVQATLLKGPGDEVPVAGWGLRLADREVALALNDTVPLPLEIDVPQGTPPGSYNVTFTTRLSREALQNLTIPVVVQPLARVDLVGAKTVDITPGRPIALTYSARNTGNVEGTFALDAQVPSGWNASFSPSRARLAPGERISATLLLNASADARDGSERAVLAAQLAGNPATPTDLGVRVARPELYLSDVTGTGKLRSGDLILVTATVGNRGGMIAENVSVALLVDDRIVDKVVLARVPVGTSALASLSWLSTQRGGSVSVVLDPDNEFVLASRANTAAAVEFGSILGTPAPGLLPLFALALGLAVALRARRSLR